MSGEQLDRQVVTDLLDRRRQANPESAAQTLDEELDDIASALDQARNKLPKSLIPFADRLRPDVDAARDHLRRSRSDTAKNRMTKVESLFDFEHYPAVEEYAATAPKHPACVDP